ncbi:hypothetical protein IWW55_005106 [Coemansia sp. RSA 2706]|nr:hypothetical protein IWW55_005106 [Coemansia sp. RSA 2706]KAJ2308945.1 hypothetical protein IWW52_005815 [Coemansia sp. RSA 2704]KAJ2320941.1 hypothetical protein IWW51_004524 [Coemansia sp. RSA 2702]KAJ2366416.1 hypothetical protein H4S01_002727 [Coemansia sp. RSA 2610]KAJ2388714.1 hypothetical protein H4S02_002733 [Coemansia sp. RSA 2611]
MTAPGDSSHFDGLLASLKNCTSKAEALKILGANAKEESSELRLYCPRNTNYVYATVANDKVVGCGTR